MKLPSLRIVASALAAATVSFSSAFGATATIDLGGVTLASGTVINLNSGTSTVPADTNYTYSLSGTVHGTGSLALLFPNGTSLAQAFETIKAGSSANLSGTYNNVGGTLPVGVLFNKATSGTFGGGALSASITFSASIDSSGQVHFVADNISVNPNLGTIVFDSGSAVVTSGVGAPSAYLPDASIDIGNGNVVGEGVYSTNANDQKVKLKLRPFYYRNTYYTIQNSGTASDSFDIKGDVGSNGFKIRYFKFVGAEAVLINKDVKNGQFNTGAIAPGNSVILGVQVINKSAPAGVTSRTIITSQSTGDDTKLDRLTIQAAGK